MTILEKKIENIFINIFYEQHMSASKRAHLLHSLPLSENTARNALTCSCETAT